MKKGKPLLTLADINWLIDSMKLVFPTKAESTEKLDQVMKKLDKFVGDIDTKRKEQTLHDEDHERIHRRVAHLEKHVKITPFID